MGLPNVSRYPEATVARDETSVHIRFSGPYYGEQKMSVPLQYVGAESQSRRDDNNAKRDQYCGNKRIAECGRDSRSVDGEPR